MEDTPEDPQRPSWALPPLVLAALTAITGALGAQAFGPLVAVVAALLPAFGVWRGDLGRGSVLALSCGLPAALGALPPPRAAPWAVEGPVRADLEVVGKGRVEPDLRVRLPVVIRPSGHRTTLRLRVPRAECRVLPQVGDRLTGLVRATPSGDRSRLDGDLRALEWVRSGGVRARAGRMRERLATELLDRIPGPSGLVVCHLVLGDGPTMPREIRDAHRATGLSHLLAVSGAHATLLAGMLGAIAGLIRGRSAAGSRRFRRFTLGFLALYSVLTGLDPPVLRALVAWGLWSTAQASGRRVSTSSLLAAPALLTAALFPLDLRAPGFWLSYAAVIGLWAAAPFSVGSILGSLRSSARASAWAFWTTMPIALAWFGTTSVWTVLGTPLCAGLVAVMLGLGVLVCGAALVAPGLADLLTLPLVPIADLYVFLVKLLDRLPWTPVAAPCVPHQGALWAMGVCAFAVFVVHPTRKGLAFAALLGALPSLVPLGADNRERFELLPVGHGQAALFVDPEGRRILIDCGSLLDGSRASRRVLASLPPGPRTIDLLVLTHEDGDHWNGVPDLLHSLRIRECIVADGASGLPIVDALREHGAKVDVLRPGQRVSRFGCLEIVAPRVRPEDSANNRSLWTRYEGSFSALLPADAETPAIRSMLDDAVVGPCDVLVLPHHGRGEAESLQALRAATQPRRVFVSMVGQGEQLVLQE